MMAAMAALALAGCSQAAEQTAERETAPTASATTAANAHPLSGLEVVPVTVTTADGTAHTFRAELAASADEQRRGLMFRTEMGPDEGMLFPYAAPQVLSFWMHNTVLPLDLVFIDADRTIINIGAGEPYNETSITSDRPGIAVLELNAGRAAELGIAPGDRVDW
ncbi:hypothetical protein AAW00_10645 [Aurantiacibacter luteus]|uniref:DUF192 domain-containing protein n=2 Tax=Aurantiacibacter luteus TaxID=1581420 RepID=A0A0G9MV89_9SPHN|nr:hypothetical protein AAW00_10645 [Aurantiacibacter luteus]